MADDKPAVSATAVTKSDTAANAYRALYIGGAGDVAVILDGDTVAVTFVGVPAGTFMPVRTAKVMAANTTATNIVGLK